MNNNSWLVGMAQRITGDDCEEVSSLVTYLDRPSLSDVREVYESVGIRWHAMVENDVNRVLEGYAPEYFLGWNDWVKLYRENHNVWNYSPVDNAGGFVSVQTISERLNAMLHSSDDLVDFRYKLLVQSGWACPVEQEYFYKSDEWQRLAKATRFIDGNLCRRCRGNQTAIHVHHESPIKSAYSRKFDDNFQDWNLTLYCKECHNWFHKTHYRLLLGNSFEMMDADEMAATKKEIAQFWKRYHAENLCEFCKVHK